MTKEQIKKNAITLIILVFLLSIIVGVWDVVSSDLGFSDEEQAYCEIMGIELHGSLTTYDIIFEEDNGEVDSDTISADYITWAIEDAEFNDDVSAIFLEVDSYGGSGVAGDEIATALKNTTKPTVVMIRDGGISAAYWAATGADYIIASPISDVGGIGVTASYLDYSKQNQREGISYIDLSSAKFKDMGDHDKIITAEEKALWQRDLDISHQYFVEQVANNRGLKINKVKELADGSTLLGQMALDNGLIDELGGIDEVIQYLMNRGVFEYNDICWYQ